jgi:hypothetical protein
MRERGEGLPSLEAQARRTCVSTWAHLSNAGDASRSPRSRPKRPPRSAPRCSQASPRASAPRGAWRSRCPSWNGSRAPRGAREVKAIAAAIEISSAGDAARLPREVHVPRARGTVDFRASSRALTPITFPKIDHEIDSYRLNKARFAGVRDVPMSRMGFSRWTTRKRVLSPSPSDLSPANRKARRTRSCTVSFKLAVFPLRLLSANPYSVGLPSQARRTRKALAYLYPSEDLKVLACARVPCRAARHVRLSRP